MQYKVHNKIKHLEKKKSLSTVQQNLVSTKWKFKRINTL